jgi:hypothetical protein
MAQWHLAPGSFSWQAAMAALAAGPAPGSGTTLLGAWICADGQLVRPDLLDLGEAAVKGLLSLRCSMLQAAGLANAATCSGVTPAIIAVTNSSAWGGPVGITAPLTLTQIAVRPPVACPDAAALLCAASVTGVGLVTRACPFVRCGLMRSVVASSRNWCPT